jgi:hypothetical protein
MTMQISIPDSNKTGSETDPLLRLEQEDGAVSHIEVDEVFCFCGVNHISKLSRPILREGASKLTVRNKASEVSANNAVPGCAFSCIKLYLESVYPVTSAIEQSDSTDYVPLF